MQPILILREAAKKVPFLNYAIGIVGICAAITIIGSFNIGNYKIPIITICFFILLMLLLSIVSQLATSKDKEIKRAKYILIYSLVVIICVVSILFTTSLFFDFPKPISNYPFFKQVIVAEKKVEQPSRDTGKSEPDTFRVAKVRRPKLHKIASRKPAESSTPLLEVSIQLESSSEGYDIIKVNGKRTAASATSTPFNPRIWVESDPVNPQLIEIITKKGDTCVIEKVFNEREKENFPFRFVPDCKTK
jgi:hypothetical protein